VTFSNENAWDRAFRILLGVVLGYAAWVLWPGGLALISAVIGAVALITGVIGWCPLYALFHVSTKKKASA
jgi:hypothetical protein